MLKRALLALVLVGAALGIASPDVTLHPTPPPHPDAVPDPMVGSDVHPGYMNMSSGAHARWDNLVAGWKMDETSDGSGAVTRVDVLGVSDLTDVNTTPSAAGKLDLAASFTTADTDHLSLNNPAWSWPNGLTINYWYNQTANWSILSHDDGLNERGFIVVGGIWYIFQDDATFISANFNTDQTAFVWEMVTVWWDPADSKAHAAVNAGTVRDSAGTITGPQSVTFPFRVGRHGVTYSTGMTDELYVFSDVKDAAWRTAMYNGGGDPPSYPN